MLKFSKELDTVTMELYVNHRIIRPCKLEIVEGRETQVRLSLLPTIISRMYETGKMGWLVLEMCACGARARVYVCVYVRCHHPRGVTSALTRIPRRIIPWATLHALAKRRL